MIEEEVVVKDVDPQGISVVRGMANACSGCTQTCSSAALGKALQREVVMRLPLQADYSDLKQGDRIVVGIDESAFLGLSLKVYLLPLGILFAGAACGAGLAPWFDVMPDFAAIIGGATGLLTGFGFLRLSRSKGNMAVPIILRKLA